jgi:hypothetical protein
MPWIYRTLSRVNHSCNTNAVVVVGGVGGNDNGVSMFQAAYNTMAREEITISYLGKYHNDTED